MDDAGTQNDELFALKCIYDTDFEFEVCNGDQSYTTKGKYNAYVDTPPGFKVIWKDLRKKNPEVNEIFLRYLPAMVLSFSLPLHYPSMTPPNFSLSCKWLRKDQISKLCLKLDEIWEKKKEEILFDWTLFLKDEALKYLSISDVLDISILHTLNYMKTEYAGACKNLSDIKVKDFNQNFVTSNERFLLDKGLDTHMKEGTAESQRLGESNTGLNAEFLGERSEDSSAFFWEPELIDERAHHDDNYMSLVTILEDFNKEKSNEIFLVTAFLCRICFESPYGSHCIQFQPCCHVFCRKCMKIYFEGFIKDGRVQNMNCPSVSCSSVASPSQVKEVVSEECFAKYDADLLQFTLDAMTDIIRCPFVGCKYPVTREPNENMASCPLCRYVFCVFCKAVYHGVEPCRYKTNEKQALVREYLSATPENRMLMEQKYGKKQLKFLVESSLSEEWIKSNSKNCPHCKAAIQKSDGCNKMTCSNCKINFCWICMAQITTVDPYDHYNAPGSKCAQKLFLGIELEWEEGEGEDDDDDDYDDDDDEGDRPLSPPPAHLAVG